ncbi:DUF2239 family protein [Azorhizobium doebereinerae]|uniref:DUF2239 family protein n=1 Tax=Azorhizobium doebereinerae TaxID=281091 RepID=UPI00041D6969|nr:DUF2239 family protein [Azorhizobium doebereinerae]
MTLPRPHSCTAFAGQHRLASGSLLDVALAIRAAQANGTTATLLAFDDASGRVIDLDLRGTTAELAARFDAAPAVDGDDPPPSPRSRGRPKLGVVAREVTLLPRHWEWLSAQPGGASVALRRLVEAARRTDAPQQQVRAAQEAAYRFMSAMAGDLPGFEEATRALFAGNRTQLEQETAGWPPDVRAYALRLAFDPTSPHVVGTAP